jgi:hypothetical protein
MWISDGTHYINRKTPSYGLEAVAQGLLGSPPNEGRQATLFRRTALKPTDDFAQQPGDGTVDRVSKREPLWKFTASFEPINLGHTEPDHLDQLRLPYCTIFKHCSVLQKESVATP